MNNTYQIKSERQSNGLWGTPMSLVYLKGVSFGDNQELISAIWIALAEAYSKSTFQVAHMNKEGMLVVMRNPKQIFWIKYSNIY